jgi:Trypsin-like peptidase domain
VPSENRRRLRPLLRVLAAASNLVLSRSVFVRGQVSATARSPVGLAPSWLIILACVLFGRSQCAIAQNQDPKAALVTIWSHADGDNWLGTGVSISKDGSILTCYHLIEFSENIFVRQGNRFFFDVVVDKVAPELDLAVLKVDSEEQPSPFLNIQATDVSLIHWSDPKILNASFADPVTLSMSNHGIQWEQPASTARVLAFTFPFSSALLANISLVGTPVLSGGTLVGLVLGTDEQQHIFVMPVTPLTDLNAEDVRKRPNAYPDWKPVGKVLEPFAQRKPADLPEIYYTALFLLKQTLDSSRDESKRLPQSFDDAATKVKHWRELTDQLNPNSGDSTQMADLSASSKDLLVSLDVVNKRFKSWVDSIQMERALENALEASTRTGSVYETLQGAQFAEKRQGELDAAAAQLRDSSARVRDRLSSVFPLPPINPSRPQALHDSLSSLEERLHQAASADTTLAFQAWISAVQRLAEAIADISFDIWQQS